MSRACEFCGKTQDETLVGNYLLIPRKDGGQTKRITVFRRDLCSDCWELFLVDFRAFVVGRCHNVGM